MQTSNILLTGTNHLLCDAVPESIPGTKRNVLQGIRSASLALAAQLVCLVLQLVSVRLAIETAVLTYSSVVLAAWGIGVGVSLCGAGHRERGAYCAVASGAILFLQYTLFRYSQDLLFR
jgi:hypothetical protein